MTDFTPRNLELDDNPEPWQEETEEFVQQGIWELATKEYEEDRKNRVTKLLSMFPWLPIKIMHQRLQTTIVYHNELGDPPEKAGLKKKVFEFLYFWPEEHLNYIPRFDCLCKIPGLPPNGMEFKNLAELGDIFIFEQEKRKETCLTCNPKWKPGELLREESKW